jgi:hypothetical protein
MGQRVVTAISLVAIVATVTGCHANHPGTDADRAACARLGIALRQGNALHRSKGSVTSATVLASYRQAIDAANRADDPKLRAAVLSISRYVLLGGNSAKSEPDTLFPLVRCPRIGRTMPTSVSLTPISTG